MASGASLRRAFLEEYSQQAAEFGEAAKLAESVVAEIISDQGLQVSQVSSRVKTLPSVRAKMRDKKYKRPQTELTDSIGLRVLTYYGSDVDDVARALASNLRVNKSRSVDKRTSLGLREFGYRSVHLVAKLDSQRARDPRLQALSRHWFEIQIRSLLEHAWAAIEHEIAYKSRIDYPRPTLRRFAALAGALEILDREFFDMQKERDRLVEEYKRSYGAGRLLDSRLDSARLIAFMENVQPTGPGWRTVGPRGRVLPPRYEADSVGALRRVHLSTPRKLGLGLKQPRFRAAAKRYASVQGISFTELSHLAIVAILVGLRDPKVLAEYLPEFAINPDIAAALAPTT